MKKNTSYLKTHFLKGDNFYLSLINFKKLKAFKGFIDKQYSLKNTHVSYRVINHWCKLGLVQDSRKKQTKWRKLSLSDLVWIKIIGRLRKFGLSLNKIKKVRQELFYSPIKKTTRIHQFEMYIGHAMLKRPCLIIVFEDGSADIGLFSEYKARIELIGGLKSHLIINLNDIVQEIFSTKDITPKYTSGTELNTEELSLMLAIRSGNYKSIKIRFKDKSIKLLELEKEETTQKRINQILKENNYQDIQLTQSDGKIVKINRIIKQKL